MRILFKNLNLIPFISIFLLNLSLQSQTIWNCVEESESEPATCTNEDNKEIILDSNRDNFSLKLLGTDFVAYIKFADDTSEYGEIKAVNNKYFVTFFSSFGSYKIEINEKVDFIGKTVEYFFNEESERPFKYYKGEYIVDDNGAIILEGNGFAELTVGGTYTGQFKDSLRHGLGEWNIGDEKFVGEFEFDEEVNGTLYYSNGDVYSGNFLNGFKHGSGEYKFALSGERYVGTFYKGYYHGIGTYYYKNLAKYEGEYLNGKMYGEGVYYYQPGSDFKLFLGTYKNDKPVEGTYILSNDKPYASGQIKDNNLHGEGTRYSYTEDKLLNLIIKGNFKNGNCHGICNIYYSDGSSFKGEFINGERKGIGELQLQYTILNGYFDVNGLQGNGVYNDLAEGYEWEGPFIDGKREGQGVVTFKNNGDKFSATFENDIYVGSEMLTEENFKKNRRLALVIGNDEYISNPLQFAVADSNGISIALEESGFDVTHITNVTQEDFLEALYDFKRQILLSGKNTDVLFYYAGHASQVRGINYLNPIDAVINRESQLEIKSINVNRVFEVLNESVDGVKIAILDACRNNPFTSSLRSAKSGLAQMNAPPGTIIAYSTAPGETAIDGSSGGLGIYTGSLIGSIRKPNIQIEEVFKETRKNVVTLTGGEQIPWESSSLISDFYFTREN